MPDDNWKHRSAGMRCATCMWFVRKTSPEGHPAALGRCRRHAPGQNGGPGWPPVFETDWCGDHRLDEAATPAAAPPLPAPPATTVPATLAQMTPEQQVQMIRAAKARGEIRKVDDPQRIHSGRHPPLTDEPDTAERDAHYEAEREKNAEAIRRHEAN